MIKRRTRFIDEDRVDLVDDGEMVAADFLGFQETLAELAFSRHTLSQLRSFVFEAVA